MNLFCILSSDKCYKEDRQNDEMQSENGEGWF